MWVMVSGTKFVVACIVPGRRARVLAATATCPSGRVFCRHGAAHTCWAHPGFRARIQGFGAALSGRPEGQPIMSRVPVHAHTQSQSETHLARSPTRSAYRQRQHCRTATAPRRSRSTVRPAGRCKPAAARHAKIPRYAFEQLTHKTGRSRRCRKGHWLHACTLASSY